MSFGLFVDGDFSERTGKLITFAVTMVSMALGFTLIPLLPQPLPLVIAFLVAYAVYRENPYAPITGSLIISMGLFYHLSRIGFFQLIDEPITSTVLKALLVAPFIICPILIHKNLQIIAMDMGIVAVSLLFFDSTFYLAIPLILVFATIYKERGIAYTFIYYASISLPLQIMQYMKTYSLGVLPPLYTPLDAIYEDIQKSLSSISLETILKVLNTITGISPPEAVLNGEREAFAAFINSLPGMALFLIIMSGLISVIAIINMKLPDPVKETSIPGKYVDVLVYFLPIVAAAITNVVFFGAIEYLQVPLSFQATVDRTILVGSTAFTILFSAPVSFSKYVLDLREVRKQRIEVLRDQTKELMDKLDEYLRIVDGLGNPVPETFIDLKTKMLISLDETREMHRDAEEKALELAEVDAGIRLLFLLLSCSMVSTLSLMGRVAFTISAEYCFSQFFRLTSIASIITQGSSSSIFSLLICSVALSLGRLGSKRLLMISYILSLVSMSLSTSIRPEPMMLLICSTFTARGASNSNSGVSGASTSRPSSLISPTASRYSNLILMKWSPSATTR